MGDHWNLKGIKEMKDEGLKAFGLRQIELFRALPKEEKAFLRQFRKKYTR